MMGLSSSSSDEFLVKKLKEILLKIYPTISSPQSFQSLTKNETLPYPYSSSSISNITSPTYQETTKRGGHFHFSSFNLSTLDDFGNDNNHGSFPNGENNGTLPLTGNRNTRIVDSNRENELMKGLQEFIQILKLSLSSSSNKAGQGMIGGQLADMGVEEVNWTTQDITDFNNLMDDENSQIPLKQILIIISYILIACVSIIGNLLVLQLVIRSRRLHTLTTYALLANLAIADLLMVTLNIPFTPTRVMMAEWPFGHSACHILPFVQVISVYVNSISMAVIAYDRYQVIMNPLGRRMKSSQGILICGVIWILSALLSLPFALHHKVVPVLTIRVVQRCQAEFRSIVTRQILTVATFFAQYLIPLCFTTTSYILIMQRLRLRSTNLGPTTPRQYQHQARAKRKTIKMLFLVVIFFAVSWAPINIYHLLTHFFIIRPNSTTLLVCHLIAMSSSLYNPFIYCWLNEHFRREALKWLRCFRTRRSLPENEANGLMTRPDSRQRNSRNNNNNNNNQSSTVHFLSLRSQQSSPSSRRDNRELLPNEMRSNNNNNNIIYSHQDIQDHELRSVTRPEILFMAELLMNNQDDDNCEMEESNFSIPEENNADNRLKQIQTENCENFGVYV